MQQSCRRRCQAQPGSQDSGGSDSTFKDFRSLKSARANFEGAAGALKTGPITPTRKGGCINFRGRTILCLRPEDRAARGMLICPVQLPISTDQPGSLSGFASSIRHSDLSMRQVSQTGDFWDFSISISPIRRRRRSNEGGMRARQGDQKTGQPLIQIRVPPLKTLFATWRRAYMNS